MTKKSKLEKALDEASKGATHIVSNPKTIKQLQAKGLPIKERFITYEEYFETLVADKRKHAVTLLRQLSLLDPSIANSVIAAIYEEVRASFGLGVFTSTIFNSILLLEYALRVRVFDERLKADPNSKWEHLEQIKMKSLIGELRKKGTIDKNGKEVLDDFNDNFRNPYLHINIHKMITSFLVILECLIFTLFVKFPSSPTGNFSPYSKHLNIFIKY